MLRYVIIRTVQLWIELAENTGDGDLVRALLTLRDTLAPPNGGRARPAG